MSKRQFISALRNRSIEGLQAVPKSDLHSHAGRGGTQAYVGQWAGVEIAPPTGPFRSLAEMNQWLNDHVKCHLPPGLPGYLKRVEAAFAQARADHIAVLALSYDMSEVFAFGGVREFVALMEGLQRQYAPDTLCLPDLALGYSLDERDRMDEVLDARWFRGIDICNYQGLYTLDQLKPLCRKARAARLTLKAHAGEFDGADAVMRYVEALELDQIQHGIGAAQSPRAMNWLADHHIQLNLCPTSNILLGAAPSYREHPIRRLYDAGVPVTINTDDLLIFNASASQEYLNLYEAGAMTPEALNEVRETGLRDAAK